MERGLEGVAQGQHGTRIGRCSTGAAWNEDRKVQHRGSTIAPTLVNFSSKSDLLKLATTERRALSDERKAFTLMWPRHLRFPT